MPKPDDAQHPLPPPHRLEELASARDFGLDVALGAALVARDTYATLDVPALMARFDTLAAPLAGEELAAAPPAAQAARLASYLYGELGFRGNEAAYYDPKNSLLPDVLDRRLGIPLTLGIVYLEVAKRLGVPARGVSFPGHFLVRLEREGDAPVFVDPFFGGRVLDEASLVRMLERALGPGATLKPEHLARATPRAILLRLLTNLKAIYLQRGDHARAHLALDRMVTLARDAAREAEQGPGDGALGPPPAAQLVNSLRERGLVAAKLGAREAARADLTRVLELAPDARDAASLRAELAKLEARPASLN